jgi:tetratricopeptide (TPR) repeat protein
MRNKRRSRGSQTGSSHTGQKKPSTPKNTNRNVHDDVAATHDVAGESKVSQAEKMRGWLVNLFSQVQKTAATLVTLVLVGAVAIIVFSDVFQKDAVVIESFTVNSELQNKGYDGETLAKQVVHNITLMIQDAASIKQSLGFDVPLSTKVSDVEVPGAKVSAKSLLSYIRALPPVKYIRRELGFNTIYVEGEASLHGELLRIDLRILRDVNGNAAVQPVTFSKDLHGKLQGADSVFTEVSTHILKELEPYLWAVYLYRNKQPDKALKQIEYCMFLDREHSEFARLLEGLILIDQKNYEDAIAKFEELIKMDNGRNMDALAGAYNNWGLALLYQGNIDLAITKFDKAMQLKPNHAPIYSNYGKAFLDKNEPIKAREKLEQALRVDPKLAIAYFHLAYTYWTEDPEKAISLLEKSIEIDPTYAPAYNRLGLLQATSLSPPKYDKAITNLQKAIALEPDYASAWANLGLTRTSKVEDSLERERAAELKEAVRDLGKAVELYLKEEKEKHLDQNSIEAYAKAYNDLGWTYEVLKDYQSAVLNYEKAFEINPNYYYALTGKGDALRKAGKLVAALSAYDNALQQSDADQETRLAAFRGKALVFWEGCPSCPPRRDIKNLEQAVEMFTRAQEIKKSDDIGKKLAEAQEILKRLRNVLPQSSH